MRLARDGRTRRAVVTGGAGFLGSHLCERLLRDGYEVVCLDNYSSGDARNLRDLEGHAGFQMRTCDISTHLAVPGRVDLVVHMAALASPVDYLAWPMESLQVGSIGTLRVLEFAREKQARLVLASTSEVYGDPAVHPQTEDYWGNVNPIGPRAVYDEAKRFGEAAAAAYRRLHDTDVGIIRIFNTYGPRMRTNDGRIVPSFTSQALADRPITVHGDGRQTRSLCYVDDLIEGIVRMCHTDHPGPINLGNPEEMTVVEIAELIKEIAGSSSPLVHGAPMTDDPSRRCPDISLAQAVLGWRPTFTARAGLERTVDWFRDRHHAGSRVRDLVRPGVRD
ncbi:MULTISPECIES: NAD-dependent epimerase/dehydratase family protein [Actinomadura]|uniref:SDR family oxidoreductase n=1 Tax=Actinomadura miaoliensis TaxID=430685 RepID=A0ABP7WRM2_9ACTN